MMELAPWVLLVTLAQLVMMAFMFYLLGRVRILENKLQSMQHNYDALSKFSLNYLRSHE